MMDDLQAVVVMTVIAYIIEYLKINLDISLLNVLLFINLMGIYFIIKKFKVKVHIEFN
jgi:hypothetical protein